LSFCTNTTPLVEPLRYAAPLCPVAALAGAAAKTAAVAIDPVTASVLVMTFMAVP